MIWLANIAVAAGVAHLLIAYKEIALPIVSANIPYAPSLGRYTPSEPLFGQRSASDRPEQFLQLEQITGLLLPVVDANVADWIAGAMQQKQRHQPSLQCRIDIRVRISEALKKASDAARHFGRPEGRAA